MYFQDMYSYLLASIYEGGLNFPTGKTPARGVPKAFRLRRKSLCNEAGAEPGHGLKDIDM
jgi:hypothetical protein